MIAYLNRNVSREGQVQQARLGHLRQELLHADHLQAVRDLSTDKHR